MMAEVTEINYSEILQCGIKTKMRKNHGDTIWGAIRQVQRGDKKTGVNFWKTRKRSWKEGGFNFTNMDVSRMQPKQSQRTSKVPRIKDPHSDEKAMIHGDSIWKVQVLRLLTTVIF